MTLSLFFPDPGSHHHAAGRQGRGKRALASPSTPAAAEGTAPGSEAVGTNSAEGTQGGHHGVWNVSGFNHTMLPPSSPESHHPGEPSQFSLGTLGKCSNTWEQGECNFPEQPALVNSHSILLCCRALWIQLSILTMHSGQFSGLLYAQGWREESMWFLLVFKIMNPLVQLPDTKFL